MVKRIYNYPREWLVRLRVPKVGNIVTLAAYIGVSPQMLRRYMSGEAEPGDQTARRIEDFDHEHKLNKFEK